MDILLIKFCDSIITICEIQPEINVEMVHFKGFV